MEPVTGILALAREMRAKREGIRKTVGERIIEICLLMIVACRVVVTDVGC